MLLWQSDSRAVAAAACTISPRAQERKNGVGVAVGRFYHNKEPMLLNVSVVEKLQITFPSECHKRCHMHTAATFAPLDEHNGQQASGQMCRQLIYPPIQEKSRVRFSQSSLTMCENVHAPAH